MQSIVLKQIEDLQYVKGVAFPAWIKYRQLIVTGPPGSGKSQLVRTIGGWPEEGYIDLTLHGWWRARALALRPREVHLGFPFVGRKEALTVFEEDWLNAPEQLKLDIARIVLPPPKGTFLSPDWRGRFVFEFLLPPAEEVLKWRQTRSQRSVHPVDRNVTLEQVVRQIAVFEEAAVFFKQSGILIYVRDEFDGVPKDIVLPSSSSESAEVEGQSR